MAVSASLRRLLRVRTLEEELSRQALESAMAELHRLEAAMESAGARQKAGRRQIASSANSGEVADRLVGIEQVRLAALHGQALAPWRDEAQQKANERRAQLLARRIEMRQAETLVKEAEARAAQEADRRAQLTMDDWFGSRLHRLARVPEVSSETDKPDAHTCGSEGTTPSAEVEKP